jgi:flagellar biosynthesis/type III secretory pathway protein FliH
MSSSNQEFRLGLHHAAVAYTGLPRAASVVTAAPFAVAPQPATNPNGFQPMVFQPFGGRGKIVSLPDASELVPEIVEEIELVEPEPELPPDYEAIKAEAWRDGFQVGYDEGLRLAAEEQHDTGTRLSAMLQGIASDTEALVRGVETQVIELALAIAEKVIAREARIDPEIVLNVVRSALSEVNDATELRIHANPEDVPLLETRWQEMLPKSVAEHSELISDDLVDRGGVIVETRIGYADSQLKTRLNQVVTTFQGVLDGEPG